MTEVNFVVVTGMSGAGRTTVLRALEDHGYFCVDNLPPPLIPGLVELLDTQQLTRIGLGIDVRTGSFLEGAEGHLKELSLGGRRVEVLFLEAQDGELIRRFSETRRAHPLAAAGDVPAAIEQERARLAPLRMRADRIIDTTGLSVHDLRRQLSEQLTRGEDGGRMQVRFVSFGFKFGLPVDADLVFDLRYLPNPYFVPELRPKSGLDPDVANFVLQNEAGQALFVQLKGLLAHLLPRYEKEGKSYLTVAVGCTGGRHRSVAMAEALKASLDGLGNIAVQHRDSVRHG